MGTEVLLDVNVIGWTPRPTDPPQLHPQFVNPVPVRIYTSGGIEWSLAWLSVRRDRVVAVVALPHLSSVPRCFCCTEREYDPRTHLERRRITSIDIAMT